MQLNTCTIDRIDHSCEVICSRITWLAYTFGWTRKTIEGDERDHKQKYAKIYVHSNEKNRIERKKMTGGLYIVPFIYMNSVAELKKTTESVREEKRE